jgi:hypothetical protein
MTLHHSIELLTTIDFGFLTDTATFLAQKPEGTDLMANAQSAWDDFLQTGKAGALAFGVVMGYIVRGITA